MLVMPFRSTFFNTGHVDTALYFYDLSDKCATQHGHVRMLAYNKLNRLSLNLTGHRAQEVVADAPAIETELKKRREITTVLHS